MNPYADFARSVERRLFWTILSASVIADALTKLFQTTGEAIVLILKAKGYLP
jgi:hypothetical protein